jgi:polyisoprenoid-binding protein YceI
LTACKLQKEFTMLSTLMTLLTMILTVSATEWTDLVPVKDSAEIRIEGTSSLHDWTVKGTTIIGNVSAQLDSTSSILLSSESVAALVEIGIPVRSLASGKKGMDEKMFKALEASTNDLITFQLTAIEAAVSEGDSISATATGNLTIAGNTRAISMPIQIVTDNGILKISGSLTLEMTTFGIKPPKAMLGLIRTGNAVDISFAWGLKPQEIALSMREP